MTRAEVMRVLTHAGVVWPGQHPVTGNMLTECTDFRQVRDIQRIYRMWPNRPRQHEPIEWSDEGHVTAWLDRTDEEMKFALEQWERECQQHDRDGGLTLIPGRAMAFGSFLDETGAACAGQYDPASQQWHWTASSASKSEMR